MSNIVQSAYNRYMSAGSPGVFATTSGWDADTRVCETSAGIGFGLACSKGAADIGAVLGGTNFVGISVRDITLVHTTPDKYAQYDNMAVAIRGDIWVRVSGAVTAGQQAHYNTSTGALASSGGTAITGAKFVTSAADGALAILRLGTASEDLTS